MFLDRFITPDELWATAATFTVVAWAFAYAFMAIQIVWPGSFTAAVDPMRRAPGSSCSSCRSPTSRASGCRTSRRSSRRRGSVVMIEQVAGLMYVALVISRIVGLQLTRDRLRSDRPRATTGPDLASATDRRRRAAGAEQFGSRPARSRIHSDRHRRAIGGTCGAPRRRRKCGPDQAADSVAAYRRRDARRGGLRGSTISSSVRRRGLRPADLADRDSETRCLDADRGRVASPREPEMPRAAGSTRASSIAGLRCGRMPA